MAKLKFDKRQLSKVNAETVVAKCIEVNFDEAEYVKWARTIAKWDEFVAKEVEPKQPFHTKKLADEIDADNIYPAGALPKETGEKWTMM